VLVLAVFGYLSVYMAIGAALLPEGRAPDGQSLAMKAYGSCAFLLLTLVLAIGPLVRLDPRLLPLLYNRRHLGVVTFLVALMHALEVLGWHFAYSPVPPLVAMLSSEPAPGAAVAPPFVPLGVAALLLLFALAATSHDFWLEFLGPSVWKALHMGVYAAYALAVGHVALGQLQDATNPGLALLVLGSAASLVMLHLAAAWRGLPGDRPAPPAPERPWVLAGPAAAIPEGRAVVVRPAGGEKVAIFRHQGRLSALTNLCAHQHGPLGEGRVLDGCATCPWHGFQYRLEDGCAPPPFTERLATYNLRLVDGMVWLDPRPNPPGTRVAPLPA
jgi:nitrite reductase/ring-hydroxylating ferredoxin subunit/DMSO/TMAO reductase YedYZ heme-binding membrane subunit